MKLNLVEGDESSIEKMFFFVNHSQRPAKGVQYFLYFDNVMQRRSHFELAKNFFINLESDHRKEKEIEHLFDSKKHVLGAIS